MRVAIVTGAASGIGKHISLLLSSQDVLVVAVDINDIDIEKVEKVQSDVTKDIERIIESVVMEHQRLDYIFNNAAITFIGEVEELSMEDWNRIIELNLGAVIKGSLAAYRVMKKQGFGHIINISSIGGLTPFPGLTAYNTTKHAVVGFSTTLREEARLYGVRVSVVCPGLVNTSILDEKIKRICPIKFMEPMKASQKILKGIKKNKRIIIFPFHARILLFLDRYAPRLLGLWKRGLFDKYMEMKEDD